MPEIKNNRLSILPFDVRRVNGGNQMRIVVVIARVLLGLMFVFFGMNGFLNFLPAPPLTGVPGAFLGALITSHYVYLVCAVQVLGGLLLVVNQFVPLGVALLAPVI